jgi:bacterioferritin-associated ferredoxin
MFVCNCNGIRCKDVDAAIRAGARKPKAVHAHHGCEVQCARCLPEIAERIRKVRAEEKTLAAELAHSA